MQFHQQQPQTHPQHSTHPITHPTHTQLEQQREAAGAKPKRKRSVRRDLSGETAAEAVNNMLQSKKLSKKINYENVKMLFQETEQDTEPAARVCVFLCGGTCC